METNEAVNRRCETWGWHTAATGMSCQVLQTVQALSGQEAWPDGNHQPWAMMSWQAGLNARKQVFEHGGGISLEWDGDSDDSKGVGDDSQVFHCVARMVQRCVVRGAIRGDGRVRAGLEAEVSLVSSMW